MTDSKLVLWHVQNTASFFMVPVDLMLPAGDTVLEDFDGNTISTNLEFLQPYAISFHKAQEMLEASWKEKVEESKKAWKRLYKLSLLTGKTINTDNLKNSFNDLFSNAEESIKQVFEKANRLWKTW